MRTFLFRIALCVVVAGVASPLLAGVRSKTTKLKSVPAGRVAQADADYSGVNSTPVPVPESSVNVINERVVGEVAASDPKCNCAAATVARTNTVYIPMPMSYMPTMAPTVVAMPMANMPLCATCGVMGGGMTPSAMAGYGQAFGPGLYRSGAEVGMNHYPYYSYRRPWYFPGQPSFHRSTDYVW